jgi:hypothetical protein
MYGYLKSFHPFFFVIESVLIRLIEDQLHHLFFDTLRLQEFDGVISISKGDRASGDDRPKIGTV